MTEVIMDLTPGDIENAEVIMRLTHAPNEAQAVSIALSLTRFIVEELHRHSKELLLREPRKGGLEKVIMQELSEASKRRDSEGNSPEDLQ